MKIEIWSDIACPFCYIGKRRFETALEQFAHHNEVEVIWRSFQLDPEAKHVPGQSILDHLAERKGWSKEQAREATTQVATMAKGEGLRYDFDRQIPANTFDAHRLTHLAAQHGRQDAAEERLFAAYFGEGKNIAEHTVLKELGIEIGLPEADVRQMLASSDYTAGVRADIAEANALGVRGVPFFVFNRQYAISGAQPAAAFLQTLQQSWTAWEHEQPAAAQVAGGEVCTPDGDCA
ncbi:MAG: DsbA family oxidoreductase [Saprospiraceae bacterium]